jgi:hypothetical protein
VTMDQAAIEAQMIAAADARAQHRNFAVDGDATGTDPLLRLATGSDAHAGEHFLEPFGFAVRAGGTRAATRRRGRRRRDGPSFDRFAIVTARTRHSNPRRLR